MLYRNIFAHYLDDAIANVWDDPAFALESGTECAAALYQAMKFPPSGLTLFKYQPLNDRNVSDILNGVVHLASVSCMNDVNEGWQYFDRYRIIESSKSEFDNKKILQLLDSMREIVPNIPPHESCAALLEGTRDLQSLGIIEEIVSPMVDRMEETRSMMRSVQMCASFSEVHYSANMWDRYADSHRGFVAEYRLSSCMVPCIRSHEDKTKKADMSVGSLFPVLYGNRCDISRLFPALFGFSHTNGATTNIGYMYLLASLSRKASEWSNEREWRIVAPKPAPELKVMYANIAPVAMYLGMHMGESEQDHLMDVAKKLGIRVYKMEVDYESPDYSLKATPLKE